MTKKYITILQKIPDVKERGDLWVQLQFVANWIFDITDKWWDDDEELRRYEHRKSGIELDDSF